MEFVQLDSITRQESPLLYRTRYNAVAVLSDAGSKNIRSDIEFVVEAEPLGTKSVTVTFLEPADVPAESVANAVKSHIKELLSDGGLP